MSKTFVDILEATLKKNAGVRFTANELASLIVKENPEWAKKKQAKSKNPLVNSGEQDAIVIQVQREIGSNKSAIAKRSRLRTTEDRPKKFYFTDLSEAEEVEEVENEEIVNITPVESGVASFSEADLYPVLSEYLREEHAVLSKRINEKVSSKSNRPKGNHWLHPDLIGFEVLAHSWSDTVKKLVSSRSDPSTRFWSFEVKKLINRSNVREVFFQTASNSSWANFAYLVASEISGDGTMNELRMLSEQHGVGVIQLTRDNPIDSSILLQAQFRSEIDWSAANRLCDVNSEADELFLQAYIFHNTGEINQRFWEP